MSEPIRIRARTRQGVTEVHVLMPHPMETGLRHDEAGRTIEAHYITEVEIAVEGRTVLSATMGIAISQDPLLAFRIRDARVGDRITVSWIDNLGARRFDEARVA